jgi:D-alanyl-D-alanine carboxypeptidase (penicillin-binding protein 5/6)
MGHRCVRLVRYCLVVAFALVPLAVSAAPPAASSAALAVPPGEPPDPQVTAATAAVIELATGQVLWSKDLHTVRPPASVTKMLTALTAIELAPLDTKITIQDSDLVGESSMGLETGETVTLETLLYGMLLPSGNDAAAAIARGLGRQPTDTTPEQSVQHFVDKMNAKAKALGTKETHFANPHGLDDPNHLTSAYDLGIIAAALAANPTLLKIAGTVTYDGSGHTLHTTNKLLYDGRYPAVVAGKTGQTDNAGYTLIEIASRNGRAMLSVEMGTTADAFWTDAMHLLDYGYATPAPRPGTQRAAPPAANGTGSQPTAGAGTGTAPATTVIPVPASAAAVVNKAEHTPQAAPGQDAQPDTAAPVTSAPAATGFMPTTADTVLTVPVPPQVRNRTRLRFLLFLLLAVAVTGILVVRRAALQRALTEMRREWQQALADPPHLVATTVLPVIATGGTAPSVYTRWEELGVRVPNEDLSVARAFALQAVRQAASGNRTAAQQAFRRAVALDPKLAWGKIGGFWELPPVSYADLATAMIEAGYPAVARSMLTVAMLAHPRHPDLRAIDARLNPRPVTPPIRLLPDRQK